MNKSSPVLLMPKLTNHKNTEIFKIKEWKKICQARVDQNKQDKLQ